VEFSEVVRRRRMVRRYDPERPVADELIDRLLAAALRAPSAGNTRGVSFLVLREPADVGAYWSVTAGPGPPDRWLQGMRTAPLLILVWTSAEAYLDRYARPDKGWTDRDPDRWSAPYWYVDAGMAALSALLSAVDSELGACFFGVPPDRVGDVRRRFGVPEEQLSVGVLSLGHPAVAGARQSGSSPAGRPAAERLHEGRWSVRNGGDV
jgi:nitroreductase